MLGLGRRVERKNKTEQKEWQEKAICYWQNPTHFQETVGEINTVNVCCQYQPCWGAIPTATPQDKGSGPLRCSLRCSPTVILNNLGHKGLGKKKKSLRWLVLWFVAEWQSKWWMHVLSNEENPRSLGRRGEGWHNGRYSVVIQSLNLTHVESLWWRVDWKPWKKK